MNDRNIYTNYDKNDNLISINFKNQRYDLTKMTKEEAIKDILKQDESIKKDIISGKVKLYLNNSFVLLNNGKFRIVFSRRDFIENQTK